MNHKLSHLIGLIDKLPDDQAKMLLARLMKEDPIVGFKLLTRQYGFADLRFANREGLAALFESVSTDVVLCALNGSSDTLVRKFTQHLSTTDMTNFIERLYAHRASDEPCASFAKQRLGSETVLNVRPGRAERSALN